jgi:hypothetical protein
MLQHEKTHWNINPKSKAPPPLTTHPHRHVEENEARRRHRARGIQCHGPDEARPDEHNRPCRPAAAGASQAASVSWVLSIKHTRVKRTFAGEGSNSMVRPQIPSYRVIT